MNRPIIFLMGPSGIGKTTLANCVAAEWNYIHIDYDQWGGDENVFKPLRDGWESFKLSCNVKQFRDLIENTIPDTATGAVLSFPSDDMMADLSVMEQAKETGLHIFIMYADANICRQTFIEREKTNGRGLPVEHWDKCNSHIYESGYLTSAHMPYLLEAYTSAGQRRTKDDLLSEIKKQII